MKTYTLPAEIRKADIEAIGALKGGFDDGTLRNVAASILEHMRTLEGVLEFLGFAGRREADGMYRGVFRFVAHRHAPPGARFVSFDMLLQPGATTLTESEDSDGVQSCTDDES